MSNFVVTVVLDHRDDPKASTGNFEVIYRQVIPQAPSYLGLNLCLKGTQMLPPSNGKDKATKNDPNRPKIDRKRLEKKPNQYTLSPKSLDFENKENQYYSIESLTSPRKATLKRNTNGALAKYKSIEHLPQQHADRPIAKLAFPKFHNRIGSNFTLVQLLDASRRHRSCGPRLVSMNGRIEDIKTDQLSVEDGELEPLECVGNKLGSDTDEKFQGNGFFDSAKSSARIYSLGTPYKTSSQYKCRPLITMPKARLPMPQSSTRPVNKQSKPKITTIETSKYRKYLTPICLRSRSSLSLASSVHYEANDPNLPTGGFNLLAWRTKTGRTKSDASNAQPIIPNGLKH